MRCFAFILVAVVSVQIAAAESKGDATPAVLAAAKSKHVKELKTLLETFDKEKADLQAKHAATVATMQADASICTNRNQEAAAKAQQEQAAAVAQERREGAARLETSLTNAKADAANEASEAKQERDAALSRQAIRGEAKLKESALTYISQIQECVAKAAEEKDVAAKNAQQELESAGASLLTGATAACDDRLQAIKDKADAAAAADGVANGCSEQTKKAVAKETSAGDARVADATGAHAKEIAALNEKLDRDQTKGNAAHGGTTEYYDTVVLATFVGLAAFTLFRFGNSVY